MKRAKKRNSFIVTPEQIVSAWMSKLSLSQMADSLGMSKPTFTGRVARLRKVGVRLPVRRVKLPNVNVRGLNALIVKLAKEKK